MIYPDNFEDKIEFTVVKNYLSAYCVSAMGKENVEQISFSDHFEVISKQIRQTSEFCSILELGDFPEQHYYDMRAALKRIRIENSFIDVDELFNLHRSLSSIIEIRQYLRKKTDTNDQVHQFPELCRITDDIVVFPEIVREISRIIDELGNVKDSASKELLNIRREKKQVANNISRLLGSILQRAQNEGLIEKNISPSMRDGRLVIPVAPAIKRKIKGIVHDESDTGRTVYIEPTEVVEANNHIRELENEERREIIRIMREISSTIRPHIDEMITSYVFLGIIDFIRAKAQFARITNSVEPQLVNKREIDWCMAVHPLLKLSFDKKNNGQHVVPLNIQLHAPHGRILLISGPNAGGKSVCLKTVGLLQYMLQCGMLIPVAESSVCGIFQSIFIDIGDEQSIESDLSTYSSHLTNMKQMLKQCNAASLLLIDEFGGGTEPQVGGAMAEAILKRFNMKHAFGVITTHYQNLKHFAKDNDGIVNAAMLYDRQEMRPLFQLQIGNPGSSFAVEIARKIGIPDDVIKDASDIVGSDYINADKYLQDIVRDKRYWENKRVTIHQHEKRMEETIQRYEHEIQQLKEEKRAIIAKAKEEAQSILAESNAQIEQTIREIKEAQAEKEKTRNIRENFSLYKRQVREIDPDEMDERIQRQMERIVARQKRKADKKQKDLHKSESNQSVAQGEMVKSTSTPLFVGSYVRMKGQSTIGKILKFSDKEALVAFGDMQINVNIKKLEPSEAPIQQKRASTFVSRETQDSIRDTSLNFKSEIDVRGMRTDEALQAVTYFVDDALVACVTRLRILHGTGSGILKTQIRHYLSTIPAVANYYDEHPQFGGAGITIVELV